MCYLNIPLGAFQYLIGFFTALIYCPKTPKSISNEIFNLNISLGACQYVMGSLQHLVTWCKISHARTQVTLSAASKTNQLTPVQLKLTFFCP